MTRNANRMGAQDTVRAELPPTPRVLDGNARDTIVAGGRPEEGKQ